MALFFSSLRGLPRFGGKPKDDAIFDKSKNGRQPGARPQSTLVERDPLSVRTAYGQNLKKRKSFPLSSGRDAMCSLNSSSLSTPQILENNQIASHVVRSRSPTKIRRYVWLVCKARAKMT